VKLLLTSAGIRNESIHAALVDLLPKPIAECEALAIPTATYGHPATTPGTAWRFIAGQEPECPMVELGWKSVGVLELTALPTLPRERWVAQLEAADVLLVNGGDALYLAHHMRACGFDELLPSLEAVWVGLSGGSMVMSPRIGEEAVAWTPPEGGDKALGIVDFAFFPHVDHPDLPGNTMAAAKQWAAKMDCPAYAIDDETAFVWVDGEMKIVSEGTWKLLNRPS
jgi:dipeptidase E